MFKIFRYFSIASLLICIIAAVLLAVFNRSLAIKEITYLSEYNNTTIARAVLNTIRPQLVEYLQTVGNITTEELKTHRLPAPLAQDLITTIKDTSIVKIKIYNRNGLVVFSTQPSKIGENLHDNEGFQTAMHGQVVNEFIYRDTFNAFDFVTEEDNLVQSYLPVRTNPVEPIVGVLEIYTDMNELVQKNADAQLIIILGASIIILLLYLSQLVVVRWGVRIIHDQQRTINEKNQTLQILSARLLTAQESERAQIAQELHEGIAQTLSTIKLYVENASMMKHAGTTRPDNQSLQTVLPIIQEAIEHVRRIAMGLRPSVADDFDIAITLKRLVEDLRAVYSSLDIKLHNKVQIGDVPEHLNIIIYRILQEAISHIARYTSADQVEVGLTRHDYTINLTIQDNGQFSQEPAKDSHPGSVEQISMAKLEGLASLSGGTFLAERNSLGGTTTTTTWKIVN